MSESRERPVASGDVTSALPGSPAGFPFAELAPGSRLGNYVILKQLGQGGMGTVFEARDSLLDRLVAVKVLPPVGPADGEGSRHLLREARAAARLSHPNVVAIYEIEEYAGGFFLVMELVPQGSAQDRLRSAGAFGWKEATRIVADTCRALVAAHAAGVIHRDVKPANLLLGPDGTAKLADFGLARSVGPTEMTLTGGGRVAGTPDFMSPEQCRGEPIDARTDVYSLGATYYTLLTLSFAITYVE